VEGHNRVSRDDRRRRWLLAEQHFGDMLGVADRKESVVERREVMDRRDAESDCNLFASQSQKDSSAEDGMPLSANLANSATYRQMGCARTCAAMVSNAVGCVCVG
jgi:hypothetical protein